MDNTPSKKRNTTTNALLFMGCAFVVLALFGLLFDPEKHVMITVQMVAGVVILILYFIFKGRSEKSKE